MLRKLLACVMAGTVLLSAFTVTSYFAAGSVSIVNPPDHQSSSGQLGMVENEVVDIPDSFLSSSSDETTESSSQSSEPDSSVSSSASSSAPPSSVTAPPPIAEPGSSTVSIPSSVAPPPSSSSTPTSSGEDVPTGETLIVKISSEPSVGAYAVNDILPRIVAMEMDGRMDDEALTAQAVATHSSIKYQNSIGKAPVVYVRAPSARIQSLVESVSSQMIYYNGRVIDATYCASTAGRTESSADVWGGYLPYLVSVESAHDSHDPNWGSQTVYTVEQVRNMVKQNAGIELAGNPEDWFKVVSHTAGGYNGDMTIGGQSTFTYNGKTYKITGRYVQTIILRQSGLPALKSAKFDVSVNGDQIVFTTYGYGHGVGMSQWGAHYYAVKEGYSYQQILTHYYTGVTIR